MKRQTASPAQGFHLHLGKGERWALMAALAYALNHIFVRVAVRDYALNYMMGVSLRATPTFLFALLMGLRAKRRNPHAVSPISDWRSVAMLIGYGLLTFVIANPLLFAALRVGGVSVATPITGTQVLWAGLIAALLLHEPLNRTMVGGMVITIAGIALLAVGQSGNVPVSPTVRLSPSTLRLCSGQAGSPPRLPREYSRSGVLAVAGQAPSTLRLCPWSFGPGTKGSGQAGSGLANDKAWWLAIPFALGTALCWSLSGVLVTGAMRRGVDRFWALTVATGSGIIALNLYLSLTGDIGLYVTTPLTIQASVLLAGLLNTVALVSITTALSLTSVASANTLNSLQSGLAPLLAWLFLGEQLNLLMWVGILLITGGAVIVQRARPSHKL